MNLFGIVASAAETANTAAGAAVGAQGEVNPIMQAIVTFFPMIAIIALMYFMLIRPQRKKEKELKAQIDKMKIGDKVVTIGGIIGKVYKIKDNFVIIETGNVGTPGEKSFVKFERDAIKSVEKKLTN